MYDDATSVKVLLIEDDPVHVAVMQAILRGANGNGIRMETATTLRDGLDRLRASAPDAVLLDLSLPDAEGLEGLRTLAAAANHVPVIIMTGLDDDDVALEAVQRGAQDFLVKGKADKFDVRRALRYAIERHRLQQQLLEAQRQERQLRMDKLESLGVLAGGIAHDFNNLLMGIMGNISLAKDGAVAERDELLAEAERAAARATALTRQLLTFARGGEPVKTVLPLQELLKDAVLFGLRGSNVSPTFCLPDSLWAVEVDPAQISHVFHNIVINANQAMPNGGALRISAENVAMEEGNHLSLAAADYVKIAFEDQGPGIPPQFLAKIFDPYFTTKQKGSGLGLATALSVVKKHGGTISVDSILGHGSTFFVYLPACKQPPPLSRPATEKHAFHGERILVMDDEEHVRKLLRLYLQRLGLEVVVTVDGADALGAYRAAMQSQCPFAAVVTDLTVPGAMGGLELAKALFAVDPAARVIISSGYSDGSVMSNHRDYGFCGVLVKPYRIAEIEQVLASALRLPDS